MPHSIIEKSRPIILLVIDMPIIINFQFWLANERCHQVLISYTKRKPEKPFFLEGLGVITFFIR